MSNSPPHKLLIVRLGALGDIVHAIPVAAALRRALPDVRIDWLDIEGVAAVRMPTGVTRLYIVSDDNFSERQRTLLLAFDVVE